ncbi:MAG TPA: cytochrome b N-terminal domain-containing protein [Vicinamibacterales bacterium]
MTRRVLDWLDSRTGYRALLEAALHEPLPRGTGWFFTTGSIVTLLIGVQFITGVGLSMYYVPSPSLAYDSVRYIMTGLPLGWMLRGLHFWGASFLVVAAVVHMVRVFFFGSYKAPREVTWLSGVLMLLVILGFALSGYLLPWDQKAYWATTVTINVARSTPLVGDYVASVMRGGAELGALTLGRWFAAHVFLLPMTLVLLIASHIALMRKHGISGPLKPSPGAGAAFFPWHVIKDTIMMAAVFASLFTIAALVRAPLDEIANPADASYIPRPEWYFLSLFQLLKYFPGPLEPVATMVLPGIVIGYLFLLPFLDRGGDRYPLGRSRRWLTAGFVTIGAAVVALTLAGVRDRPEEANDVSLLSIAGERLVEKAECQTCHVAGGAASSLSTIRLTRDDEWLLAHLADPVVIAPGVRPDGDPAPKPKLSRFQATAVLTLLRRQYAGKGAPVVESHVAAAADVYASVCVSCHKIGTEGGKVGPNLTHVGSRRDEETIRQIIEDPLSNYDESEMPPFGEKLSKEQIGALAKYLASRK